MILKTINKFSFFKVYIDRNPFIAGLWLRVAAYQSLGEVL